MRNAKSPYLSGPKALARIRTVRKDKKLRKPLATTLIVNLDFAEDSGKGFIL